MATDIPPHSGPAWEGWISPENLAGLARSAAPYLWSDPQPAAFHRILRDSERVTADESLLGYFQLCLACHHATVASFVPTDVDSKIRGLIWRKTRDRDLLRAMVDFAIDAHSWPIAAVSRRGIACGSAGVVSGHDGEWLSVMMGALGRMLAVGDTEYSKKCADVVEAELSRQSGAFLAALRTPGRELDALGLCAALTHNAGDVDQGISFWEGPSGAAARARFGRLAHENGASMGGGFAPAARLYKDCMAAEGHRNYPLRGVKALRASPDLLLPISPFLDAWGVMLMSTPMLTPEDRAETLDALVKGCRKIPGQQAYYRAIAGMASARQSDWDRVVALLPNATRRELRDNELRRLTAIPRASFESGMRKRVTARRVT